MQEKPKKQVLKVYCYKCKADELTDCCVVCSRCRSEKIGIEESEEMHQLCRLFASRKGWVGDPKPFSLPGFFQSNPQYLKDWEALKNKLTNPESLQLPELPYHQRLTRDDAYRYWFLYSGVLNLFDSWDGGGAYDYKGLGWSVLKNEVTSIVKSYPITEKLACAFVDYHREKGELAL